MKKIVAFSALIGVIIVIAIASNISGCTTTLDGSGLKIGDPVREAQATRVALAAIDESEARALDLQTRARVAEAAMPAEVAGAAMTHIGARIALTILLIGMAFACVAVANKVATSYYPNSAGLYPVIVRRFWNGVTIVHDPNRALGATTIYTTAIPAPMAQLTGGQDVTADMPMPTDPGTLAQIAGQAQIVQALAAQNKWPRLPAIIHNFRASDHVASALPAPPAGGQTQPIQWPARVPLTGLINGNQISLARLILGVTVDDAGISEVIIGDMANMVHVAVGGSSGYGKSQFLRILAYQMTQAIERPDLVMIDLEHVTFAPFEASGRLLYPIADTESQAVAIFAEMIGELDRRRSLFSDHPGVDSLSAYNHAVSDPLRPICILIDESTALLGDKAVQAGLRPLALRARKYGLWMVLGGQDWKANGLDTAIRNQLGTRVQFKAMSASQSRVLLERAGAETLEVPGRALAILPGRGLVKMQAPFIPQAEIEAAICGDDGPRCPAPELEQNGGDDIEARAIEMHAQGLSQRQIENELFGYAGGKAHSEISRILTATTTA